MLRSKKASKPAEVPFSLEGISYRQHLNDFRNWRRTLLLLLGTLGVGVGIGLLIVTELGASPADAAFVSIASRTGLTVGTVLFIASLIMLVIAYFLGRLKPALGTIITFVGISVSIDVVAVVGEPFFEGNVPLWVRIAIWFVGASWLGIGAACLMSAQLGASAYDQFVQAGTRLGVSIPVSRVIIDTAMVVIAFALGGMGLGFGTIGLLVLIPLLLKYFMPPLGRWASPRQSSNAVMQ